MRYIFFYSKSHDDTPRWENRFRYEICDILPTFKGKEYTAAYETNSLNINDYLKEFPDAICLGTGTLDDCEEGKYIEQGI